MRYKMIVSYDGGCFNGWQKQSRGRPTVQGTLETILSQVLRKPTRVIGSGRTDAGVHAVAQVAHFDASDALDHKIHRSLNALAPEGLVINSLWRAPGDFHALASSVQKTYVYRIWNDPLPNVFRRHWTAWVSKPLDLEKLNDLSELLVGQQDFRSFQTKGTPVPSTIRTIESANWRIRCPHEIEFRIVGDGFLKQMVRNIVGTLLYLERKSGHRSELAAILAAKDRQAAKATAPPHGLYLLNVQYPAALDNQCRKL